VVFNLLSNAVKFTPRGGAVTLDVTYDSGSKMLHCSVTDTGPGIAGKNLKKIFNTFEQEDNSTTRKFGGTGLGLSISLKLVEMMGGRLNVESTPGSGSRFFFEMDVMTCDDKIPDASESTGGEVSSEMIFNGHLLIVEDNKTNQMLLSIILDEYHVTYDIANNGIEALNLYVKNSYDIILMDENMPEMNGIEATRRIRDMENESGRHTPIIAVTANAMHDDRQLFLDAGMDEYLSKPYEEEQIVTLLGRYLKTV